MSWGKITNLFKDQGGSIALLAAAGNESFTTDVVVAQRLIDEQGAAVFGFTPNPGNIQGFANLEARLSGEASFGEVFTTGGAQIRINLDSANAPTFAVGATGLAIFPEMRFSSTDTNTVNNTTMFAHLLE